MQRIVSPEIPRADQTVAEILRAWPQTIRVFLDHHMACVGCAVSAFDTLDAAAANYGKALDAFLEELRRAIQASLE